MIAPLYVLTDQVANTRCLSCSRFPDRIGVLTPVGARNSKRLLASPDCAISNVGVFIVNFSKSNPNPRFASAKGLTTSVFNEPSG